MRRAAFFDVDGTVVASDIVRYGIEIRTMHRSRLGRLAYDALRPGGQLLIHDFFVDDDHQGPRAAALWFIAGLFNPDAVSLTPGGVTSTLEASGFTNVTVRHVIPGITRLAIARKPA